MKRYTDDDLKTNALLYPTRVVWKNNSPNMYGAACRRKLMDICCSHMVAGQKGVKKWSDEDLIADALNYQTRSEWENAPQGTYQSAYRRGMLDICCKHMSKAIRPSKYTLEYLLEYAHKYTYRSEWKTAHPISYNAAYRLGLLEVCCSHMKRKSNPYTDKMGVIYSFIFEDNSAYVGLSVDMETRYRSHMVKGPVSRKIKLGVNFEFEILEKEISIELLPDKENFYIDKLRSDGYNLINTKRGGSLGATSKKISTKQIYDSASKFKHSSEWMKEYPSHYNAAIRRKILAKVCSHMTRKPGTLKHSDAEIIADASKHTYLCDWRRKSNTAYNIARKRGIVHLCCAHMIPKIKKWSNDDLIQDAKKYNFRSEWERNSASAYTAACVRNMLPICCSHMKFLQQKWTPSKVYDGLDLYKTKKEWKQHNIKSYAAAKRLNIVKKCLEIIQNNNCNG